MSSILPQNIQLTDEEERMLDEINASMAAEAEAEPEEEPDEQQRKPRRRSKPKSRRAT